VHRRILQMLLLVSVTSSVHTVDVAGQRHPLTVRGTIMDSSSLRPVEQVAVFVDGRTLADHSDATGSFQVQGFEPAPHVLLLLKDGFAPRMFRFVVPEDHEGDVDVGQLLLQAGPAARAKIAGTVTDATNEQPVFGAAVTVNGVTMASTDLNGVFSLPEMDVQWGTNLLGVRRFGYTPMDEEFWAIQQESVFDVTIQMTPFTVRLPKVVVEGERTVYDYSRIPGFERRRRYGLGRYFTKEDIVERNAFALTDVFAASPGTWVQNSGGQRYIVMTRGWCSPAFYIDGMRVMGTAGVSFSFSLGDEGNTIGSYGQLDTEPVAIDEWVNVDEVVGVEVYSGAAYVPLRFSKPGVADEGRNGPGCGVILIWTNRGR